MSITVSSVTPVYSGEKYLRELVHELSKLREKWSSEDAPLMLLESIFVDDGSQDNSSRVLSELQKEYEWVHVIELSRNFGQHAATVAGICHTSTDWVVTLDEDLQHKPEEIEKLFIEQARTGTDIVYALPSTSVHGDSWRDSFSRFTKRVIAKLTDTPQIKAFNSFRLVRGSIARAAASSSSSSTYFDVALSWFSKSFSTLELTLVDERYTKEKESGYGISKLISHARKLIVSSQVDVTATGIVLGAIAIVFAFSFAVGTVFQKLAFPDSIESAGWASIVAIVTFFGGVIITLLCIALEYLNICVLNQLGKPTFYTIDRSSDQTVENWYLSKN